MWPNPQETADLLISTEELLNGKLYFLCSETNSDHAIKEIYGTKVNVNVINVTIVLIYLQKFFNLEVSLLIQTNPS